MCHSLPADKHFEAEEHRNARVIIEHIPFSTAVLKTTRAQGAIVCSACAKQLTKFLTSKECFP